MAKSLQQIMWKSFTMKEENRKITSKFFFLLFARSEMTWVERGNRLFGNAINYTVCCKLLLQSIKAKS